jgi:hypothetical protein
MTDKMRGLPVSSEEWKRLYPEHAKLSAVKDQSQVVGAFLDWLTGVRMLVLCESTDSFDHPYVPAGGSIEKLLAEYFKIDRDKIEVEKRDMLARLRAANADQFVKGGGT